MTDWDWPDSSMVRVVDGDTFVAEVERDLGFHGTATFTQRIRLNRINTPKVSTAAGKLARDKVKALLSDPPMFHLTTVGPYKYGDEWMGEVVLEGGTNLSDYLVQQGLAVYWDGQGPRPADG